MVPIQPLHLRATRRSHSRHSSAPVQAGFDYWVTDKWKFGADLVAVSSQYFFQDGSNLNDPLGGYWTVDLHTRYDITDRIQIFGLVNNVFDREHGVFGTSFNLWMPVIPARRRTRSAATTSSPIRAPSPRRRP